MSHEEKINHRATEAQRTVEYWASKLGLTVQAFRCHSPKDETLFGVYRDGRHLGNIEVPDDGRRNCRITMLRKSRKEALQIFAPDSVPPCLCGENPDSETATAPGAGGGA